MKTAVFGPLWMDVLFSGLCLIKRLDEFYFLRMALFVLLEKRKRLVEGQVERLCMKKVSYDLCWVNRMFFGFF